MINDNGFTEDSVRSLIYLLCTGNVFTKINDFNNDEIFVDTPLIGFSTDMNNDIRPEGLKGNQVYLNTNSIYEVARLAVKAFETYSLEKVFNEIKKYFSIHNSIYRFNKITVFYRIDMGNGLYDIMKGYYKNGNSKI